MVRQFEAASRFGKLLRMSGLQFDFARTRESKVPLPRLGEAVAQPRMRVD